MSIESINQVIEIDFFGFDINDKTQKINVEFFYKDKKIDTTSLCKFFMKDDKINKNQQTRLESCNNIFFNGRLQIQFFREWFECNLLDGAYINNKKRFMP